MLPKGWGATPLNTVLSRIVQPVDVDVATTYQEIGIRSHGKGVFHKQPVSGMALGDKRVFWVIPNALVLNIVFAWEQAVAVTSSKENGMIASHRFPMYLPKQDRCDVEYLRQFFCTPRGKALLELASPGGAGRNKTLGQKEFERLRVPMPCVDEQQRIRSILQTWDQAITITERMVTSSRKQKQALLAMLTGGASGLSVSQLAWRTHALGDLGFVYGGLSGKSGGDFGMGSKYIPYVNVFKNDHIDLSALGLVYVAPNEKQSRVEYGDVLFTTSSETPNEVGMAAVLLDKVDELYLNSFCFGYRLLDFKTLLPEYAKYVLRSPAVRSQLIKLAQGSTRFNISKTKVMRVTVCLPSLEEQRTIVDALDCASSDVDNLSSYLDRLRIEKAALMAQLLTGKRRVCLPSSTTEAAA